MYALLVFVLFLASVLVVGAALAWPVHTLLTLWLEPDFERVTNRTVLVLGILVFLAVFRKVGFGSWQDIGFGADCRKFWSDAFKGFRAGILIMGPVVAGLLISQNRVLDPEWDSSLSNLAALLASAALAGCIVALIEETLFRGALLTAIQRRGSAILAITATSFFYALVHFLQPETYPDPHALTWTSGFVLLGDAFSFILNPAQVFDSFIALFAAGILLAIVRVRTGRLALCVGMHAGWVFTIKLFKRVTNSNDGSPFAFLTGTYDQVIGYLAAVCLILAIVIYLKISYRA